MPQVQPNQKLNFGNNRSQNEFIELKKKGDAFTIRLADYPMYYGQHWTVTEKGKRPIPCSRINSPDFNNPQECSLCDKYNAGEDELKPVIRFIFPVLDRKTKKAVFFETSQMVWREISNQESKGIKILDYDWLVERTENKPNYYEVTRLEKDILSPEEQKTLAEAKSFDVQKVIDFKLGRKKSEPKEIIIEDEEVLDDSIFNSIEEAESKDEMPF